MTDCYCDRDYCESCEMEYFQLIEALISNIKHLEAKTVFLRYTLSNFLPLHRAELLRSDIFSDLSACHIDLPAYHRYISTCCDGTDPLDDKNHCKHLKRLSRGEVAINL